MQPTGACSSWPERRAELEQLIADSKSEYHGDASILEDPDQYRAANTFIVPPDARWSRIASEVRRRDDVKVELDRALKVVEDAYPERLRGLLPPIYGDSNMDAHNLRSLIDLFSKDVFKDGHGEDVIGLVYEYFIGEFASSEGKRGGEFFTPASIVRTLVSLLEPEGGTVYDPCCGSGGMFVQSDEFARHSASRDPNEARNNDEPFAPLTSHPALVRGGLRRRGDEADVGTIRQRLQCKQRHHRTNGVVGGKAADHRSAQAGDLRKQILGHCRVDVDEHSAVGDIHVGLQVRCSPNRARAALLDRIDEL
jgi:hypothetical protein